MIALFKNALEKEIDDLKRGRGGRQFNVHDGKKVYSSRYMHIYRFLTDFTLKGDSPVNVSINNQSIEGQVVSSDLEGINIGLKADMGESIEKARIDYSLYRLLEDLILKLEKARLGSISLNLEGSMKLFGFFEPDSLLEPVPFSEEITQGYNPNIEQQIAIKSSLTQEVTFIWGPPGTGKTKTLGIILNELIKVGKRVLLTSHTNTAVDEILKKFMENEENATFIESSKIIRHGTPSLLDNRLNELLIDNILEKQTLMEQKKVDDLRNQIDSMERKIKKYKELEEDGHQTKILLESKNRDYDKIETTISNIQGNISTLNLEKSDMQANLSSQHILLKKAQTANLIKRVLFGLNVERVEKYIKELETKQNLIHLKLQSLETELQSSQENRDDLSEKINQLENHLTNIIDSNELISLESLKKTIQSVSQEAKEKDLEIKRTLEKIETIRDEIFNNAQVIGCTLTRAYLDPKIFERSFDVLILDEASMATLPTVFFVAGLSLGHYIISGDFRQLPPIAVSKNIEAKVWLTRDIFTQAGVVERVNSHEYDKRVVMLREQYRMHPDICSLINDAVYDGRLTTPIEIEKAKRQIAALPPFEDRALTFCDTSSVNPWVKRASPSYSRLSPYSAVVTVKLASALIEEGKKKGVAINVGIVTPYKAQAQLISKILEDEHIDSKLAVASTIHKFQGNERTCIIFDLVEGQPFAPGILTKGLFDSESGRLITVAISRAEGKFILVGNGKYIKSRFNPKDAVFQLMENISKVGAIVDSNDILSPTFESKHPKIIITQTKKQLFKSPFTLLNESDFYDKFREDLERANSFVVIFSPFIAQRRLDSLIDDLKSVIRRKIQVYIITRHPNYQGENKLVTRKLIETLQKLGIKVIIATKKTGIHERFHEKIGVIDESVFYHGSLNILSQSTSSESMIVFRGRRTIEELVKNFRIKKIIKKYQNIAGERSQKSILHLLEQKLLKENDVEFCPQCGKKLILTKGRRNLYFGCSNQMDRKCIIQKVVDKDLIKQAIISMKIRCSECQKGHMQYREGEYEPFLGCSQYFKSQCRFKMTLDDSLKD